MIALNRLGTAIAISSLSLAMLGCGGSGGKSSFSANQNSAQVESALTGDRNDVSLLTSVNTLSISDYSLDKCIKATGREFVEQISTLVCNNKGIQFLDGIEQLTELKILHLNFNKIEDITPLVALKQLQTLYVSGNNIYNLDPLSELVGLTELGIQRNAVQDLSPLQSLDSLKSLHTHSNQIQDFTILSALELDNLSGQNRQDS